jgi:hypothetical protein
MFMCLPAQVAWKKCQWGGGRVLYGTPTPSIRRCLRRSTAHSCKIAHRPEKNQKRPKRDSASPIMVCL